MCEFFSCLSDGYGKLYYFNEWQRLKILFNIGDMRGHSYNTDSHTSIAKYYGVNEDKLNKWEYDRAYKESLTNDTNYKDGYGAKQDDRSLVKEQLDNRKMWLLYCLSVSAWDYYLDWLSDIRDNILYIVRTGLHNLKCLLGYGFKYNQRVRVINPKCRYYDKTGVIEDYYASHDGYKVAFDRDYVCYGFNDLEVVK